MIICGYSSYSWIPTGKPFADCRQCWRLPAGRHLHIGGWWPRVVPSPIGYAHVITSTTHKDAGRPRGAVILTPTRPWLKSSTKAVFPGEQGGPHVHIFCRAGAYLQAGRTKQFEKLQKQTIKNARPCPTLQGARPAACLLAGRIATCSTWTAAQLKAQMHIPFRRPGGPHPDLAGIVVNRNTIPGDKSAFDPSGIRLGTPWITQRGFDEEKSRQLADIMADVLLAAAPHSVSSRMQPNGAPKWISISLKRPSCGCASWHRKPVLICTCRAWLPSLLLHR